MSKFFSLIRANFSEGMNIFRYRSKAGTKQASKILLTVVLCAVVMYSIGSFAYFIAEPLQKTGMTYTMLSLAIALVTVMTLMEGIYKSQDILFNSHDDDLLFSLPIKKSSILALRLVKLMSFQFLFNLLFLIPALVVYVMLEHPGVSFYLVSLLYLFLIPIIPTVLSSIIGYATKAFSSHFRAKRFVGLAITTLVTLGIFYLSLNMNTLVAGLAENGNSINEIITKIYYPIGAYNSLISNFNILTLVNVLILNLVPLLLFIAIGGALYFKILLRTKQNIVVKSGKVAKYGTRSKLSALVHKELSKFSSSQVYMVNTLFGIFLMLAVTILMCFKKADLSSTLNEFASILPGMSAESFLPKVFAMLVIFTSCMTSVTSASISLEGKSLNILKSLPVRPEKIFLAKIIMSNLVVIPLMIISDIVFFIFFDVALIDIAIILLLTLILPTLIAILGLIMNLKYPRLNSANDTEVVKQGGSTMLSLLIGVAIGIVSAGPVAALGIFNLTPVIFLVILVLVGVMIGLWYVLKYYGVKKWRELSV